MGIRGRAVWVSLALASMAGAAVADSSPRNKKKAPPPAPTPAPEPEPPPAPEPAADNTPWGKGVSAERKDAAKKLLQEGNDLFLQNHFPEALAKYQEAIGQWDHPAIHFNIVRALLALDRPLEAAESLDKALAYGADPLEADHYAEALTYKGLIAGRIGTLEVSCTQDGANIKLDGAELLACPGKITKKLLPGNHVVVGTKRGYEIENKDVLISGGNATKVDVSLHVIPPRTEYEYRARWSTWKPWAVGGAGIALAGAGVLLRVMATSDLDALDAKYESECQPDCTRERYVELGLADEEARVERNSRIGVGAIIGGGVVAAAGVALVILNRPKPYAKEQRAQAAQLVPTLSPSSTGFAVVGRF